MNDSVNDCRAATDLVGVKVLTLMVNSLRQNSKLQATIVTFLSCNAHPGIPLHVVVSRVSDSVDDCTTAAGVKIFLN